MNMSTFEDLGKIIDALESLTARVEEAQPEHLDAELRSAAEESTALVSRALPADESAAWIDLLRSSLEESPSDPDSEVGPRPSAAQGTAISSAPGRQVSNAKNEDTGCDACGTHSSRQWKECVHGCGTKYCRLACRKHDSRRHAKECAILVQRRVLKKMGLSGNVDGELF
jgi:hypothetical protein